MPDEALKASLQGRPRQAPDFAPIALGHLHTNCLAVRQLIKQYLSAPSELQLDSLATAVKSIHHTLQLLDRRGALLVTNELSSLFEAISNNQVEDADACAHTLVLAGEKLADYVAHLQKPGAIDSALPLLPVINNCRACRGEELLSEMLVVASGIDLPDSSALNLPTQQDIATFVRQIRASRQPLMTGLLGWYNDEQKLQTSLSELIDVFAGLATSCNGPTSLQPLVPLFESAEFVCFSVRRGGLESSAALHKLFAQLERMLTAYLQLDANDPAEFSQPVPERLFLNFLYYVALSSETSPKAIALRRRFRLDRFVSNALASDHSQVQFDGVGDRLADSIRSAIELETEAARHWLVGTDHDDQSLDKIRHKLSQLEPAIMLLGAQESVRYVADINQNLLQLSDANVSRQLSLTASVKESIAESLVRLERSLEVELSSVREENAVSEQSSIDSILSSCLTEAQSRLLAIESDVSSLFAEANKSPEATLSSKDIINELATIDSALQILPMPEVSPLLHGVQAFVERQSNTPMSAKAHQNLATVMVSLGYYLNSVLQPNGAAGQLLLEAEEALLALDFDELEFSEDTLHDDQTQVVSMFDETLVIGQAAALQEGEYDATIVDLANEQNLEHFIGSALGYLSTIGNSLLEFENAGVQHDFSAREMVKAQLITDYEALNAEASEYKAVDIQRLAAANARLLKSPVALEHGTEKDIYLLLDESIAVLPQLINQLLSPYEKFNGLDDLLNQLESAANDSNINLAMDVQDILKQGDIANESMSDTVAESAALMTLDNTLETVFFRECHQHMATLRQGVDDALASKDWHNGSQADSLGLFTGKTGLRQSAIAPANALPTKEMLRALHTLTGSAQTVDARGVICISQPLQKAALQKQRNGEYFDRAETEYINELLDVLDSRLLAMDIEQALAEDDPILIRLHDFVARAEPWMPERKRGLSLNTNVSAIKSVFEEEARELLETLRADALRLHDDQEREAAISSIMSCLHTIKGSARMAGQLALADRAHILEDELRLANGVVFDETVQSGLGELQTLMLLEQPVVEEAITPRPESSATLGLTEASFENMLSLSTQATVSQTRMGSSILRLRDALRDIESTSERLQRLPHGNDLLDSAAVQEMLSDLDRARRQLGDALHEAEAEHAVGSRADTTLHQTLIRAQLVSLSEARARFQYAAQDAATETGKHVHFEMTGDDLNIDKVLFRKIVTPLEHIIRNAVVHGIESNQEREAEGKTAQGCVSLDATIDGTDLLITVADDGVGINKNAINTLLQNDGKASLTSIESLRDVLCEPGFTTHDKASQLGGRGLGLANVKQMVDELSGSLQLSEPESGGSAFTLRLPQKIRIAQVVVVEHGAQCFAIPVSYVHHVSDEPHDMTERTVEHNGVRYDICSLDAVLDRRVNETPQSGADQLVLIGVRGAHYAVLVDKVIGYREIIAQPLGEQFAKLQRYVGGAVLSDGRPVLMPDFNRLLGNGKSSTVLSQSLPHELPVTLSAFIVDDSITMRIAAETMLRSFGFEASLARDGIEAIEMLGSELPDLLLVDIDMPRMNGFDFMRHLQLSHPGHTTPVLVISTRDTQADRDKAFELGATDYIVKPYSKEQLQSSLVNLGMLKLDA